MEWMEIEDGKLKHHLIMGYCEDKPPLHMVAQGEAHYGQWLMTSEELVAAKKWEDKWDDSSEWNKFVDCAICSNEEAYQAGLEAETYDPLFGKKRYEKYNNLVERHQFYYDAGFNKVSREQIKFRQLLVFRCPWHTIETCDYYRNHPWVIFSESEAKEAGPLNWSVAIRERGSSEKMQEFVNWYNKEKGKIEGR